MSETGRVYIVDDDEPVRDAVGMLLDTVGIDCEAYPDAQSFLAGYEPTVRAAWCSTSACRA